MSRSQDSDRLDVSRPRSGVQRLHPARLVFAAAFVVVAVIGCLVISFGLLLYDSEGDRRFMAVLTAAGLAFVVLGGLGTWRSVAGSGGRLGLAAVVLMLALVGGSSLFALVRWGNETVPFDREIWLAGTESRCDMLDEVVGLVEGLSSSEVEALLGEPEQREPTRLVYPLGACPGAFVSTLDVHLEGDIVIDARRSDLD